MELPSLTSFLLLVTLCLVILCKFKEGIKALIYFFTTTNPGIPFLELLGGYLEVLITDDMLALCCRFADAYDHKPFGGWFNGVYMMCFSDADTVGAVLRNPKLADKPDLFYTMATGYLGRGIVTMNGVEQRKHRKIVSPAFRKHALETHLPHINDHAAVIVERLREMADGESVDIRHVIEEGAFDASFDLITSDAYRFLGTNKYTDAIKRTMCVIQNKSMKPFYGPLHYLKKSTRDADILMAVMRQDCIRSFSEGKVPVKDSGDEKDINTPQNHLELLIQEHGEDWSEKEIFYSKLRHLLVAASDTTGLMMNALFLLLALDQEVQQRLYEEIETVFEGVDRNVEPEDIAALPYLDMVFKETMRLFPSIPLIAKRVDEDTSICGVFMPKNSVIAIPILSLHRDPNVFKDPLKFDPARFSPELSKGRHPYAYVPFSAGSRNCAGHRQANILMKTIVIQVLRNFKMLPGDKLKSFEDIKIQMNFTLHLLDSSLRLVYRKA